MAEDFPRLNKVPVFLEAAWHRRPAGDSAPRSTGHEPPHQVPSEKVKVLPRYVESRAADVQNLIL
jgi:hypothetical protein